MPKSRARVAWKSSFLDRKEETRDVGDSGLETRPGRSTPRRRDLSNGSNPHPTLPSPHFWAGANKKIMHEHVQAAAEVCIREMRWAGGRAGQCRGVVWVGGERGSTNTDQGPLSWIFHLRTRVNSVARGLSGAESMERVCALGAKLRTCNQSHLCCRCNRRTKGHGGKTSGHDVQSRHKMRDFDHSGLLRCFNTFIKETS